MDCTVVWLKIYSAETLLFYRSLWQILIFLGLRPKLRLFRYHVRSLFAYHVEITFVFLLIGKGAFCIK